MIINAETLKATGWIEWIEKYLDLFDLRWFYREVIFFIF